MRHEIDCESEHGARRGRSAEEALAVGPRRGRRVPGAKLVVPRNPEALRGRDVLVVEPVLRAAVEDTDAHHGQPLRQI